MSPPKASSSSGTGGLVESRRERTTATLDPRQKRRAAADKTGPAASSAVSAQGVIIDPESDHGELDLAVPGRGRRICMAQTEMGAGSVRTIRLSDARVALLLDVPAAPWR